MPAIATAAGDFDEPGNTLRDRLKECLSNGLPGIPVAELLDHLEQVADELDGWHADRRVFRQGVRPDVIRIDTGVARLDDSTPPPPVVPDGMACAPAYTAPEVWAGRVSPAADQYALACTYVELRTGRLPFPLGPLTVIMFAHLEGTPDLTGCTRREQAVLTRALAKKPGERFATCGQLVDELRRAGGV